MQNHVVMRIMYLTKMTQSFKVASHPLDILHSPPPSIIEAHDSATKKGTFSVSWMAHGRAMTATVFNRDHRVPCMLIEHCVQSKPYTVTVYV